MTLYASTDVQSFHNVECPSGGHLRGKDEERLVVTCAACEPKLWAQKGNWSDDPNDDALLTRAEKLAADRQAKEAMTTTAQFAEALARQAAQAVLEPAAPKRRKPGELRTV